MPITTPYHVQFVQYTNRDLMQTCAVHVFVCVRVCVRVLFVPLSA